MMGERSEMISKMLINKTPQQIEKLFTGVERSLRYEADEAQEQAQKQAASDANMSLEKTQERLEKAINTGDLEGVKKWQPLHAKRLAWVTDKLASDEAERLAKANAPILEERQKRRDELISEMDALTRGTVSGNFGRLEQINKELRELS